MKARRTNPLALSLFTAIAISLFIASVCTGMEATPVYEVKSFDTVHAAVSALGQSNAILLVTGKHNISGNLAVPGNITLRFQKEGVLFVESGHTVTINSPIQAPIRKIFEGGGSVTLRRAEAYPQWWGAQGDGIHDDGHAVQSAIDSVHAGGGGVVRLLVGTYLLNHVIGAYYVLKSKDKVSVIGGGEASILKIGDGLRSPARGVAVLYNHEELVSECRYAFFTIDYNGKANPRLASWGEDAKASNVSRMGAEHASDVMIEGIHFKDVTGAHCVWFGNHASNRRNTVRNCVISNVGQSVPGNQLTDHSSIYIGGTNAFVSGNVFRNQTPCNISTAIEVHSSDTVVSNNVVTNYSTGANIGGEANDCQNVTLIRNTFKNCRNGVILWHYTPHVMKNITVSENIISVRESEASPYPPSMGVIYGGGYVTSRANMTGLRISGNTIYQETVTLPNRQPNTGIHLEGVNDVTISGNTIYNFNGEAVYLESRSPEQGMRGIILSDNRIRNVGLTPTRDRKRAIAFNAYPTSAGSIEDIRIQNNSISGYAKSPMLNGITFNDGYFPKVEISANSIRNAGSDEIVNHSTGRTGIFLVDHAGHGPPANLLHASNGSRWVDMTAGKAYVYRGDYGKGSWQ